MPDSTIHEATSAMFPTLLSASPGEITVSDSEMRQGLTMLRLALQKKARTEKGDSARWRTALNKLQEVSSLLSARGVVPERSDLIGILRQRREEAGFTQVELAQKVGISDGLLKNIESGRRRLTAKTLRKLLGVPELRLESIQLNPSAAPPSRSLRAEPLNWWVAPQFDAVNMLEEFKLRLDSDGGAIEQTFAYLDAESALDYYTMTSDPRFAATYRQPMPLEEIAKKVIATIGKTPIDLIALGPGDGELETRFAQALVSEQRGDIPDLRFYLLDISQPLLSKAHRRAKDKLDAKRGVTVVGMWGNFHYLPLYEQLFYSPAKRRRVFSLLGYTMSNLDDERRFFRDSLRGAASGDLALIDFQVIFAPADQPALIRQKDPALNGPPPQAWAKWLTGPFRRYMPHYRDLRASYELDLDCPMPGSYALDAKIRAISPDGPREFTFTQVRRYDPERLTQSLASLGWQRVTYLQFGSEATRNPALMLLRKRD